MSVRNCPSKPSTVFHGLRFITILDVKPAKIFTLARCNFKGSWVPDEWRAGREAKARPLTSGRERNFRKIPSMAELKIDCIADTHGAQPGLSGGDILVIAGDVSYQGEPRELAAFNAW